MSSLKTKDHSLTRPFSSNYHHLITMLPVINLHAADTTLLYSLL